MAVSMNVDYTRQIYTGLSTDDWGEIEFNSGDVVYIMDQSQCWIFDGSTMQQLPDLGGGGGGGAGDWQLLASGTYTLAADQNSLLTISAPLTTPGTVKRVYVVNKAASHKSTGQWISLVRYYDNPDVMDDYSMSAPATAAMLTSGGDTRWYARITGNINVPIWYTSDTISCPRYDSTTKWYAGDYDWYIWGIPT